MPTADRATPTGSVWAEAVRRGLDASLDALTAAVRDCPDGLWQTPMWPVRAAELTAEVHDADGNPVTDPARRTALLQRWSEPWSVAWHVLEVLDYDLTGELDAWTPPPPFADHPHWRTFTSVAAWTRTEISGYVDHCRQRVQAMLLGMTDERAATPLPPAHRYSGETYAWLVTSLIAHTTAHATQIGQFARGDDAT